MRALKLAVPGAGMIGKPHAELIASEPQARLSAVVDPAAGARRVAKRVESRGTPESRRSFGRH
jgi:predicted dehydrogenase